MTACGKTQHLDALVSGELTPAVAHELRAHAERCACCRHELNWLESEAALFRQRASRDEVRHLWEGVASRTRLPDAGRSRRVLVSLAASLLLVAGLSRLAPVVPGFADGAHDASGGPAWEALVSESLESPDLRHGSSATSCSQLPEGLGFHCAPVVPASFVATR